MSQESIQGPLSALRAAGTVCGVCLARGSEVLVNLFPFSEARVADVVGAIDDIFDYFQRSQRQVDQLSFGYDGGCVCVVDDDEFRLIVMHMLPDEVDFIAKAARAFLADVHLGHFAEHIASSALMKGEDVPAAASPEENREDAASPAVPEFAGETPGDASAGPEALEDSTPPPADTEELPEDSADDPRTPEDSEAPAADTEKSGDP